MRELEFESLTPSQVGDNMDWILYAPQYHALMLGLVAVVIWLLVKIYKKK